MFASEPTLEPNLPGFCPQLGVSSDGADCEDIRCYIQPFFEDAQSVKISIDDFISTLRTRQFDCAELMRKVVCDVEDTFGEGSAQSSRHPSRLALDQFVSEAKSRLLLSINLNNQEILSLHDRLTLNLVDVSDDDWKFKATAVNHVILFDTQKMQLSANMSFLRVRLDKTNFFFNRILNILESIEDAGVSGPYAPNSSLNNFVIQQTSQVMKVWRQAYLTLVDYEETFSCAVSDIVLNLAFYAERGCEKSQQQIKQTNDFLFVEPWREGPVDYGPLVPKLHSMVARFYDESVDLVLSYLYLCGAQVSDFLPLRNQQLQPDVPYGSFLSIVMLGASYNSDRTGKGAWGYWGSLRVYSRAKSVMIDVTADLLRTGERLQPFLQGVPVSNNEQAILLENLCPPVLSQSGYDSLGDRFPDIMPDLHNMVVMIARFHAVKYLVKDSLSPEFYGLGYMDEVRQYKNYLKVYIDCLLAYLNIFDK